MSKEMSKLKNYMSVVERGGGKTEATKENQIEVQKKRKTRSVFNVGDERRKQ